MINSIVSLNNNVEVKMCDNDNYKYNWISTINSAEVKYNDKSIGYIAELDINIKDNIDKKKKKKINRIEIGAKTISNIYEDLTFVSLNNQIISNNEKLYFSQILNQRVDFFKSIASSKKIEFILDIKDDIFIVCDVKKLSKLIDNILSNAIKYNKFQGFIKVTLKDKILIIEDSGKGMSKDNLSNLFTRYKRFDKSVGGFGIGLNIVSLIAKEYDFKVDVISKIDVGTRIKIKWQD